MFNFENLELTNVVTYKKARLSLNSSRVSVIRGRNLDRKNKNASNSSGKSLLVSPIPNILFNSVRSSVKKKDGKSIISDDDSSATITLTKNDDHYKIRQYFDGSIKWDIIKNGKSLKFRKSTDAFAKIKEIIPLSESKIYSQVIVDGRSKSILQSGNSKQRFDYFEDVFALNLYDEILSPIAKQHNKLKMSLQELEVLSKELNTKKKDSPTDGKTVKELKEKQEEVSEKLSIVKERIDDLIERSNSVNTYLAIAEGLDFSKSLPEQEVALKDIEKEQQDIDTLYRKSIKYHEQLKTYLKITEQKIKLKEELRSVTDIDVKLIPEYTEKLELAQDKMKKYLNLSLQEIELSQERARIKGFMDHYHEKRPKLIDKYKTTPLEQVQRTITNNKVEKKNLIVSIEELTNYVENHDHESTDVCPICLRQLTKKSAALILETTQATIEQKNKNIKVLGDIESYLLLKKELRACKSEYDVEELKTKYKKYKLQVKKYKTIINDLNDKMDILRRIKSLPTLDFDPEQKTKPKPFVYENLQEGLQKRKSELQNSIDKHYRLRKLGLDKIYKSFRHAQSERELITAQLNKYRPLLDKAQEIVHRLSTKISIREMIGKDIKRLKSSIDVLELETKDFRIYESLRKAFGPRGLRKIKTGYFAKSLQDSMNKYAQFIYGEPISFKIVVTATNFDILAERNGKISDVRSLAGAESSAFTLLLIISILPFIRDADRCNILILDEIESGLDPYSKELFVNKFLPLLSQIVPHIIIITPMPDREFYIPNAMQYLVTKQNNVSTLKKV